MCISNMNAKASALGCRANDMACLCNNMDYQYGIRDCTAEACPGDNPAEVVTMALSKCPSMCSSRPSRESRAQALMIDL